MSGEMKKTCNIAASLYDGELVLSYDCVGEDVCSFVLSSTMPRRAGDECCYKHIGGNCMCVVAQKAAIRELRRALVRAEEELDGQD